MTTSMDPLAYGTAYAPIFDQRAERHRAATAAAVEFLAAHAENGPVLELGVGTGRIAIPLAQRGLPVTGIEISPAMATTMRDKPDSNLTTLTVADFTSCQLGGPYRLVYAVANTLFMLNTGQEQIHALTKIANALHPGGCLIIEASVPHPEDFHRGSQVTTPLIDGDEWELVMGRIDPIAQTIDYTVLLSRLADGTRPMHLRYRYCWPTELDLMASLAGFRSVSRYGDWRGNHLATDSRLHVSCFYRDGHGDAPLPVAPATTPPDTTR